MGCNPASLQDDIDSEEEEAANARELAGMKVKHSADELNEGETMVLTLADRSILDDQGEIDEAAEELENSLAVCGSAQMLFLPAAFLADA